MGCQRQLARHPADRPLPPMGGQWLRPSAISFSGEFGYAKDDQKNFILFVVIAGCCPHGPMRCTGSSPAAAGLHPDGECTQQPGDPEQH